MDKNNSPTLARIDERLKNIEKDISEMKTDQKSNYATTTQLEYLDGRVTKLETANGKVVWLILSFVISAVLYLIIK